MPPCCSCWFIICSLLAAVPSGAMDTEALGGRGWPPGPILVVSMFWRAALVFVVRILLLLLEHSLLLHLGGHHASLHWKPWGFSSYACLRRYAWLRSCLRH